MNIIYNTMTVLRHICIYKFTIEMSDLSHLNTPLQKICKKNQNNEYDDNDDDDYNSHHCAHLDYFKYYLEYVMFVSKIFTNHNRL